LSPRLSCGLPRARKPVDMDPAFGHAPGPSFPIVGPAAALPTGCVPVRRSGAHRPGPGAPDDVATDRLALPRLPPGPEPASAGFPTGFEEIGRPGRDGSPFEPIRQPQRYDLAR
jgi:hypothetical protein